MAEAELWNLWISTDVRDISLTYKDARFKYCKVWLMLITEPAVIRATIDDNHVKEL